MTRRNDPDNFLRMKIDEDSDIDLTIPLKAPEKRFIRPHRNLRVTMNYQNFGVETWLAILRGSPEQIELAFNAMYNWGATNGEMQYFDHSQTVAIFWTSEEKLLRCFYNQFRFSPHTAHYGKNHNAQAAIDVVQKLREVGHEPFMNFANVFDTDDYSTGTISAERPDNDFKDNVLAHAFHDGENKVVENNWQAQKTFVLYFYD